MRVCVHIVNIPTTTYLPPPLITSDIIAAALGAERGCEDLQKRVPPQYPPPRRLSQTPSPSPPSSFRRIFPTRPPPRPPPRRRRLLFLPVTANVVVVLYVPASTTSPVYTHIIIIIIIAIYTHIRARAPDLPPRDALIFFRRRDKMAASPPTLS